MDHIQHSRSLNLLTALLGIALIASTIAILWVSPNLALLGIALVIFACVFALVDPFRGAGAAGILAAIVGYAAALYLLDGNLAAISMPVIVTSICLLITGILAVAVAGQIRRLSRQAAADMRIIEDLRTHDPKTGLVRFAYARQYIKNEISRSQRYKLDVSLMLMEVANWKQVENKVGMIEAENLKTQLANIMAGATRQVDTCFLGSRFGILLPQTNPSGASALADRLVLDVAQKLKLDLYIGIAYFPDDAVAEEELIKASESALQIALSTGRSVVFYNQVRQSVENQPGSSGQAPVAAA